jgi:hypothetical protein
MIACAWQSLAASESNYSWSPDVLEKHLKHARAKQAASIAVSFTRDDSDYVPASARTEATGPIPASKMVKPATS